MLFSYNVDHFNNLKKITERAGTEEFETRTGKFEIRTRNSGKEKNVGEFVNLIYTLISLCICMNKQGTALRKCPRKRKEEDKWT